MTDFNNLGLSPRLVDRLTALGLTQPTPIQAKAIPHVVDGRDVMGLAQTGTGKTMAFALPMVQRLNKHGKRAPKGCINALILAPTRELARQISESVHSLTEGGPLRIGMVVGGQSINVQIKRLEKGTDILIATPGRLIDLMDRKAVDLGLTQYLVLDEADQMLDLGFIHALRRISTQLPAERQTLLFSATMPKKMEELAQAYLTDPVKVEVTPPGRAADKVTQGVHFIDQKAKPDLLIERLDRHRDELAIVFSRTKHGAERLSRKREGAGFAAGSIHGNKSQGQRDRALKAFKEGKLRVLVATDVAARGIDIPDVRHVYNFDLPNVAENYVHRIGRTARAGAEGAAEAFCAPDEFAYLRDIEKVMKLSIPVLSGEAPKGAAAKPAAKKQGGGNGGNNGRNGQRRRRSGPPRRKAA